MRAYAASPSVSESKEQKSRKSQIGECFSCGLTVASLDRLLMLRNGSEETKHMLPDTTLDMVN